MSWGFCDSEKTLRSDQLSTTSNEGRVSNGSAFRLLRAVSTAIYRKVYKDCTVRFDGNSYVVAHDLVGKQIILRVKGSTMRIFHNDCLVVTYDTPDGKGHLVQDKRFYEALRKDREMNNRKYKSGRRIKGRAKYTISPGRPLYDMDVQVRPLFIYDRFVEEVRP